MILHHITPLKTIETSGTPYNLVFWGVQFQDGEYGWDGVNLPHYSLGTEIFYNYLNNITKSSQNHINTIQ